MKLRRNVIRTSLKQSANDKFKRSLRSKRILFVYREEDSEIWWKSLPGRRDDMECERGQIICPYCNVRRIGRCQGVDQLHYQTNFNLLEPGPHSEKMPSLLTHSMDRKHFVEVRKADHVCREALLHFRRTTCCFYDPTALTSNKERRATFPSSKKRNLPICVPLWQSVHWSHASALRRANQTTHSNVDCQSSHSTHPSKSSPPW